MSGLESGSPKFSSKKTFPLKVCRHARVGVYCSRMRFETLIVAADGRKCNGGEYNLCAVRLWGVRDVLAYVAEDYCTSRLGFF